MSVILFNNDSKSNDKYFESIHETFFTKLNYQYDRFDHLPRNEIISTAKGYTSEKNDLLLCLVHAVGDTDTKRINSSDHNYTLSELVTALKNNQCFQRAPKIIVIYTTENPVGGKFIFYSKSKSSVDKQNKQTL